MLWWQAFSLFNFVCYIRMSESTRWPAGTYGIPKPVSGCPFADGFQWKKGWRSQDTNNRESKNKKSPEFHLDGIVDIKKVKRSFCMKTLTADDNHRPTWPPGQYCIYKSGECPADFVSGFVFWDDDNFGNLNTKDGTLPSGVYDDNTKIEFCCKTGGDKNNPILLPSKSPFFLLAYASVKCQMVKWAVASVEWIYYDTEDFLNSDNRGGAYPHDAAREHPTIYYCYYKGCNKTLTAVNGTFQSPNFPRNYPDGQYCSWRITVNTTQQIHLMFTNFSLQNENDTDEVYVYDGENVTGEVLGVFYGGHPPPSEGIFSSTYQIFVIFKSDKTSSHTGFRASYYAIDKFGPSGTTTRGPDVTISSPLTPKTTHTLEKTTSTKEPASTINGPSKKGGNRDERKQPQGKGFNVIAVVVPVVIVVFIAAVLIAAFFYCKRKRTKKDTKPNEVIFSARSRDESPSLLENPIYDRDLVIGSFSEGNNVYTEVKEPERKNEKEPYKEQENENPLYEAADPDGAVLKPIYDSIANTDERRLTEGNERYSDEPEERNEKPHMEQENENPLYEAADADDALFNPIYDSSP